MLRDLRCDPEELQCRHMKREPINEPQSTPRSLCKICDLETQKPSLNAVQYVCSMSDLLDLLG